MVFEHAKSSGNVCPRVVPSADGAEEPPLAATATAMTRTAAHAAAAVQRTVRPLFRVGREDALFRGASPCPNSSADSGAAAASPMSANARRSRLSSSSVGRVIVDHLRLAELCARHLRPHTVGWRSVSSCRCWAGRPTSPMATARARVRCSSSSSVAGCLAQRAARRASRPPSRFPDRLPVPCDAGGDDDAPGGRIADRCASGPGLLLQQLQPNHLHPIVQVVPGQRLPGPGPPARAERQCRRQAYRVPLSNRGLRASPASNAERHGVWGVLS